MLPVNLIHDRQREKGWQKKYHLTDTINNSANRPNSPEKPKAMATSAATALSIIIVGSAHLLIGTDTQTWAVALIPTPIAIGLIAWSTKDVRKLAHQAATNSDQRLAASIPIICATRIYLNPLNSVIKATKSRAAYWAAGTTWSTAMIAVAALLIYEGMPQAWAAAPYIAWALNWEAISLLAIWLNGG